MRLPSIQKTLCLAAITLCNGPHSVCGVCSSLNLNKPTSYLSLCLSLNSFCCNEASRTWVSLGPETRYCGFFAGFKSKSHVFKSQMGFWLGLSPSHMDSSLKLGFGWVWVPIWGKPFHFYYIVTYTGEIYAFICFPVLNSCLLFSA